MTVSDIIEMELPYLRRYARAVLGNAVSGDLAVERLLEDLLENQPDRTSRVALFSQIDQILTEPLTTNGSGAQRATPTSRSRRAFLLTAMESLNQAETATILGVSSGELKVLLEEAKADLINISPRRIVIVEDEPLIVGSLLQLVESLGHKVTGIAVTRDQAVEKVLELKPDLVLADILLADGSDGSEAVNEIRARYLVPVIFITAFPERMLAGKSGEPTFLITKPFRPEQIKAVISQALFMSVPAH